MNNLKEGLNKFLGNIPGLCETINNLLRLKKGVVYNPDYNPDDYPDDYEECSIVGSVGEYDTTKIPTGILKLEKKLEERDKENIDKSLKAYIFGIYVRVSFFSEIQTLECDSIVYWTGHIQAYIRGTGRARRFVCRRIYKHYTKTVSDRMN